jgi:hypothetical protein
MELPRDWQEFLSSLNASRVKFLLVGAHALAAHGVPRYTGDLDVWVAPAAANAKRVLEALRSFGFGSLKGLSAADFQKPDMVIAQGTPPLRIDLLTSISGCDFASAWRRRVTTTLGGETVAVLGLEDLRANKKAAGRPKDLLDVELMAHLSAKKAPRRRDAAPRVRRTRR